MKAGLAGVWEQQRTDWDWLVKADDDTFLVVENLQRLLVGRDSGQPLLLGHKQSDQGVTSQHCIVQQYYT